MEMNKEEIQKKLEAIIDKLVEIYPFDMTEAPYSFSEEVAKEAFNLGLEIAAENAVLNHDYYDKDEGDYKKYKKFQKYKDFWPNRCDQDGCPYGVDVYSINKESILKYKL